MGGQSEGIKNKTNTTKNRVRPLRAKGGGSGDPSPAPPAGESPPSKPEPASPRPVPGEQGWAGPKVGSIPEPRAGEPTSSGVSPRVSLFALRPEARRGGRARGPSFSTPPPRPQAPIPDLLLPSLQIKAQPPLPHLSRGVATPAPHPTPGRGGSVWAPQGPHGGELKPRGVTRARAQLASTLTPSQPRLAPAALGSAGRATAVTGRGAPGTPTPGPLPTTPKLAARACDSPSSGQRATSAHAHSQDCRVALLPPPPFCFFPRPFPPSLLSLSPPSPLSAPPPSPPPAALQSGEQRCELQASALRRRKRGSPQCSIRPGPKAPPSVHAPHPPPRLLPIVHFCSRRRL